MFDFDINDLDLGSRRKPSSWVVTAPAFIPKQHIKQKRRRGFNNLAQLPDALQSKRYSYKNNQENNGEEVPKTEYHLLKLSNEPRDNSIDCLDAENEEGSIEYKYCIKDPNPMRLQQLITQMKYRLSEGNGTCSYYIGVEDEGYPKGLSEKDLQDSVMNLSKMAMSLSATASVVKIFRGAHGRKCALLRVTINCADDVSYIDLRIAVAGRMDAGKSTLVAVLTHGADGRPLRDSGRGTARMAVFRHKHEIESGRTSSISHTVLGYDTDGRVINYAGVSAATPAEISSMASKMLTFIDMGGHERYLKTALYGLTCLRPDYVLLVVCGQQGVGAITKEHLAVAVALEIPAFVVITKVDAIDTQQLACVVDDVRRLGWSAISALDTPDLPTDQDPTSSPLIAAMPLISNEAEALVTASKIVGASPSSLTLPVFTVSCVTGAGLATLHAFLSALEPTNQHPLRYPAGAIPAELSSAGGEYALFQVDETFDIGGVGLVVSGAVVAGVIEVGSHLQLGPLADGKFVTVGVTGIQRAQLPVRQAREGQTATLALTPHTPEDKLSAENAENFGTTTEFESEQTRADEATQLVQNPESYYDICDEGHEQQQLPEGPKLEVKGPAVAVSPRALLEGSGSGHQKQPSAPQTMDSSHRNKAASSRKSVGLTEHMHEFKPTTTPPTAPSDPISVNPALSQAAPLLEHRPAPVMPDREPIHDLQDELAALCCDSGSEASDEPERESDLGCFTLEHAHGDTDAGYAGNSSDLEDSSCVPGSSPMTTRTSLNDLYNLPGSLPLTHGESGMLPASYSSHISVSRHELNDCFSLPSSLQLPHKQPAILPKSYSSHTSLGRHERRWGHEKPLKGDDGVSAVLAVNRTKSEPALPGWKSKSGKEGEWREGGCFELSDAYRASGKRISALTLGCSPSSNRKGAVLLDTRISAVTYWEFEALLVLLGGHWPERGLISGQWPPQGEERTSASELESSPAGAADESEASRGGKRGARRVSDGSGDGVECRDGAYGSISCPSDTGRERVQASSVEDVNPAKTQGSQHDKSGRVGCSMSAVSGSSPPRRSSSRKAERLTRRRSAKSRRRVEYLSVIHCGSVRQVARIVHMSEVEAAHLMHDRTPVADVKTFTAESDSRDVRSTTEFLTTDPSCIHTTTAVLATDPSCGHSESAAPATDPSCAVSISDPSCTHTTTTVLAPNTSPKTFASKVPRLDLPLTSLFARMRAAAALLQTSPTCTAGPEQPTAAPLHMPPATSAATMVTTGNAGAEQPATGPLRPTPVGSTGAEQPAAEVCPDMGCISRVVFRFVQRPEWLRPGSRLIVRDRSDGHVAGAGYIMAVHEHSAMKACVEPCAE